MGLNLGLSGCQTNCRRSDEPAALDPDPTNFKLLGTEKHGQFVLAEVLYPRCTNFEGRKLLLFRGVTPEQLKGLNRLDPHFTPDKFSPLARFRPDAEGWKLARFLASTY